MDQNSKNPNGQRGNPSGQTPDGEGSGAEVSSEMLFEATEAFIRALSIQDPAGGEQAAVAMALHAEALAPFDGPVVLQAVEFLRRMGYLSPEARKAA